MTNISRSVLNIRDILVEKRTKQIEASGYYSTINSCHMCALLDCDGNPIIYGTNIYNIKTPTTEHAEEQALRRLLEKYCKDNAKKKFKIDLLVIRTNGNNSKPCDRCIRLMQNVSGRINIRNVYYSHEDEQNGIRSVKFNKLVNDPDRHFSSFDRNLMRRKNLSQNLSKNLSQNLSKKLSKNLSKNTSNPICCS
jgi:cytidine deaminase